MSRSAFPDGAARAYLAFAYNFPDALAAGSVDDGPILLVDSNDLDGRVEEEIQRLAPAEVIALGGENVVAPSVLTRAAASADATAGRLSGTDRYGTAAAIAAAAVDGSAETVLLASGANYPDALAAGGQQLGPVLLTAQDTLPASTEDALRSLAPTRVILLGAQSVIDERVATQVAEALPATAVERVGGTDRFHTAALLSGAAFPGTAETAYLADAGGYADALAAGSVAVGPILLTGSCGRLDPRAADELRRLQPDRVVVLGGESSVCQDVADGADPLAPPYARVYPDYWGEVRFGETLDQARARGVDVAFDVNSGGNEITWNDYGCGFATLSYEGAVVGDLMVLESPEGPRLERTSIFPTTDNAGVASVQGLGVGSTEEDVLAAADRLGWRTLVEENVYGGDGDHYVWIWESGELITTTPALRFETIDGRVEGFHAGVAEAVSYIEGCF